MAKHPNICCKDTGLKSLHLIFLIWSATQHYAEFETQILTIMNRADYEEEDVEQVISFLTDIILRGCGLH